MALLLLLFIAPQKEASWKDAYRTIPWHHAAEVPDSESIMLELAGRGGFPAWSAKWIREAVAAAPSIEDCLSEAKKQKKLLMWYVPNSEGQHVILPHLIDRYMTLGPLSDPDVTDLLKRKFVSLKLPAGGALAAKYRLRAPEFIGPGFLFFTPDGTVVHRMSRFYTFHSDYFHFLLRELVAKHGEAETKPRLRDREPKTSTERGRVFVRKGRFDEAVEELKNAADAEGLYWRGVAQYLSRREKDARKSWDLASRKHPKSVWAMKADGCRGKGTDGLDGESPLTRSMLDPRWPAKDAYRLSKDTQWRRTTKDVEDIKRRAVSFLLQQQNSDGYWRGPRWGGGSGKKPKENFHNIHVAIAALCCAALKEWRDVDPEGVDAALKRAETFLLQENYVERGDRTAWVYADAYRLLYFSKTKPKRKVRKRMQAWVDHLLEQQGKLKGAFQHYSAYTSTFITASVIACLDAAKKARLKVPDRAFQEAAAVLEAARDGRNGHFGYLLANPAVARSLAGAASRQPLCERALYLAGRSSRDKLNEALGVYFKGYVASSELGRKSNFHIPKLDHMAGYYFFHNFHAACETARTTGKHGKKLLEMLCALPEIDGSFVDSGFSYGKSYGTAQALLALRALQ